MTDSNSAWAYLRKQEWSMGNGQCPECYSKGPSWLGMGGWGTEIGHKFGCSMAAALVAVGQSVVFHAEYERHPDDYKMPLGMFGDVNWDSPKTQALLEQIAKAHPEMTATFQAAK